MNLTPLSRRRMNDLWAGLIIIGVMTFGGFILGFTLGLTQRPHTYHCPEIKGAKPVVTMDSKTGQTCEYVKTEMLYGKARSEVKL